MMWNPRAPQAKRGTYPVLAEIWIPALHGPAVEHVKSAPDGFLGAGTGALVNPTLEQRGSFLALGRWRLFAGLARLVRLGKVWYRICPSGSSLDALSYKHLRDLVGPRGQANISAQL